MSGRFKLAAVFVLTVGMASPSFAGVLDTVTTTDDFYGSFNGTISSGATGAAATLYWDSAVDGAVFSIDLTNSAGITTDVLFSGAGHDGPDPVVPAFAGDSLEFDGYFSGNPLIGTVCVPSTTNACIVSTGTAIDLTPTVDAFAEAQLSFDPGDEGVSIIVTANDAPVPEPASLALFSSALAGFAGLRLRKRKSAA